MTRRAVPLVDFESSVQLHRVDEVNEAYAIASDETHADSPHKDAFENVHKPWTWRGTKVIPGGLLMSECAAAAYNTVSDSFDLHSIQAQFLSAADPERSLRYTVKHLSNGRSFAVRLVTVSQVNNKTIMSATVNFASDKSRNSPAMVHTVRREDPRCIDLITLDDLEPTGPLGPYMKFQRLPVYYPYSSEKGPQSGIATSVAQISPPMSSPSGHASHILGLINLSDYHVLDASLTLSNLSFRLHAINDYERKPTKSQTKLNTSLNHSVYFHKHTGFRADDLCYIEARSPWAEYNRALVQTRIFTHGGELIASCIQESFIILQDEADKSKL